MASRYRDLYDADVQKSLSNVPVSPKQTTPQAPQAPPPVDIAQAQTLARSSRNPQAQAQGQAMLAQADKQSANVARQAGIDGRRVAREQAAATKEQAAADEAARARNVRAGEAQGIKTETDVETGKRTLKTHPNGDYVFEAGPIPGAPMVPQAQTSVAKNKDGTVQATPGSNPIIAGEGALGATGGMSKTNLLQPIINDRGEPSNVTPNSTTDAKTGIQAVSKVDPQTGMTTKAAVGVDEKAWQAARKEAEFKQRAQEIDLRANAVAQKKAVFTPRWTDVKDEFDNAGEALNKFLKNPKFMQVQGNYPGSYQWVRRDSNTGEPILKKPEKDERFMTPAEKQQKQMDRTQEMRELTYWQKQRADLQNRQQAAKAKHDSMFPDAENMGRNEKEIAAEKLKLAEEKIRFESGATDEGGWAKVLARKEAGEGSTQTEIDSLLLEEWGMNPEQFFPDQPNLRFSPEGRQQALAELQSAVPKVVRMKQDGEEAEVPLLPLTTENGKLIHIPMVDEAGNKITPEQAFEQFQKTKGHVVLGTGKDVIPMVYSPEVLDAQAKRDAEEAAKPNDSTPRTIDPSPPPAPKPLIPADPDKAKAFTAAFSGLANPEQFQVGATGDGYAFIQRIGETFKDGKKVPQDMGNVGFMEVDKTTGTPIVVLGDNTGQNSDIRQLVAFGATTGTPVYMRDAGKRDTVAEAQFIKNTLQALQGNPAMANEGMAAARLAMMGASPPQIARKVSLGEMSVQNGETLMKEIYGETLKASDPLDKATLGKWLEDADDYTKQRWAKVNAEKDTEGRNGMMTEFVNDWFIENRWKPGVNFQSRLIAEKGLLSDKRTGEKAAALGGTLLEAGGSMIGMLSAPVMISYLTVMSGTQGQNDPDYDKALSDTWQNYGRGSKNTWRGWEQNRKKWLTDEGEATFGEYQKAGSNLRSVIVSQDAYPGGIDNPKWKAAYTAALDQTLDQAFSVHKMGLEDGWEMTREDLEKLSWMPNAFALSGDESLLDNFFTGLMEDHGTRQAQDYTAELTQGRGKFMSGLIAGAHAPPEEIGIEMLSTALTVGVGKVVFGGAKAAAAGTQVAKSAGSMARFRAFNLGIKEDVLKLGMITDNLAKPAGVLGKTSNVVVKGTKVGLANSITEGAEEGAMGMADRNATMSSVTSDVGVGALAGFFMGPIMGAPMAIKAASRQNFDTNQAAAKFAGAYNQANRGSDGFIPITPEQARTAMAMVPPKLRESLMAQQKAAEGRLLQATAQSAAINAGNTEIAGIQLDQALEAAQAEFQAAKAGGSMEAQFDAQAKVVAANKAKQRFTSNPQGFAADEFSRAQAGVLQAGDMLAAEAAMRTEAVQAIQALPAEEKDFGGAVAKVASGRADLLTSGERKAAAGALTESGKPFFASVQGRDVITDAGRAEAMTRFREIGALIQTTESQAIFEATTTPPQANEQDPQGQQAAPPTDSQSPPADADASLPPGGNTPGPADAGGTGATPQGQAGAVNPAAMDAGIYESQRASNPALPSIGDAVESAFSAGQPVSVSMARAAGVEAPAGYTREGAMFTQIPSTGPAATNSGSPPANSGSSRIKAEAAIARVIKRSPKLKGMIVIDEGPGIGETAGASAVPGEVQINLADLEVELAGFPEESHEARIDAILNEEIVHLAQYEAVRRAGGNVEAFYADLWKEFTPAQRKAAEATYQASFKDKPEWQQAAETVRMLIQQRANGQVTELTKAFSKNMPAKMIALLREAVAFLKEVVASGELSQKIQDAITGIESILAEYSAEPVTSQEAAPTDSLPVNGQSPTSGDGGASAAVDKDSLTTGTVVRSQAYKSEGLITLTGPAKPGPVGMEYPASANGRGFNIAVKFIDEVVSTPAADAKPASSKEKPDVPEADSGIIPTPFVTTGQAISAALKRHPLLKEDGNLSDALFDLTAELAEVIEGMEPSARRSFLDTAIDEWVEGLEAVKEARAKEAEAAKNAARHARVREMREAAKSRLRDKARAILNSDVNEVLSAIFGKGRITPKPNTVGLILARQKNGAKLTEKEMGIIRNVSDFNGMPRKQDFPGGGNNAVIREILDMLYARQGEGQMPNVMADKLIPNMETASEMFEQMGTELRTLSRGKKDVAGYNPMDDPNYEPTDAEIAEWEASQAQPEATQEEAQPYATIQDAHAFAIEYFGPESPIAAKIGAVAEHADRFSRDDMPAVRAVIAAEFARHAAGKSIPEWDAETPPVTGPAAGFLKAMRTHTAESLSAVLASLPVIDAGSALFSSPTPAQDANYMKAVKAGDMATAQAMVDEAAKAAGYNRKGVRFGYYVDGVPLPPGIGDQNFGPGYYVAEDAKLDVSGGDVSVGSTPNRKSLEQFGLKPEDVEFRKDAVFVKAQNPFPDFGKLSPEEQKFLDATTAYQSAVNDAYVEISGKKPLPGMDKYLDRKELAALRGDALAASIRSKSESFYQVLRTRSLMIRDGMLPYDSVRGIGGRSSLDKAMSSELVVQHASQIKSADPVTRDADGNVIPLSKRFNPFSDSILFSSPTQSPFYSQLAQTLEAKMPKSAPVAQVIQIATSGAKAEEVKWSGLVQAAQALAVDGKVSKDALLAYLADEGSVRFEEVALTGTDRGKAIHNEESLRTLLRGDYGFTPAEADQIVTRASQGDNIYVGDKQDIKDAIQKVAESNYDSAPTKFGQYVLPGGENYREVVLAMPDRNTDALKRAEAKYRAAIKADAPEAELDALSDKVASLQPSESYTSSHFPDVPNYVAHMRTNERDGGLFIEEIQSDRHQAGRKKGYAEPFEEWLSYYESTDAGGVPVEVPVGYGKTSEEARANVESGWEKLVEIKTRKSREGITDGVAPAPFEKTWPLAMFKRALRDAVEGGKSWIGWTVGETQNDRFDLSKQVDAIRWSENADGTFNIGFSKNGDWHTGQNDAKREALPDIVGKEVAQRIVDASESETSGELSGLDLKVGGSGMKGFYDNMLPKEIGKYVKQWGGKVETGTLRDNPANKNYVNNYSGWLLYADPEGKVSRDDFYAMSIEERLAALPSSGKFATPIWRIEITPAMKAGVSQGQALFSSPAPDSPGRSKPKTLVEFAKPYRGPSGASLVAYEWKHELKEAIDKRGEDSAVRVSNWNEAATNWQTGREIVHQFHVESPTGESRVVSLESALKLLGYTSENGKKAGPVRSIASTLRTRAQLTMEAEALRPAVEESNATAARYEKERAAIERERMPKPVFTMDGTTPIMRIGALEKFGQLAGTPESFAKRSEYDLRSLENEWRMEEAKKRAGGTGSYQVTSRLRDIEDRIAKLDRKIQEQSAAGSDTAQEDLPAGDLFSTIAQLPPGPLEKFVENTTKAYEAAPEGSKAREGIAKTAAAREGMKNHGKVTKTPQGMMDFGMSGSFGTKDQPGLFSSPTRPMPEPPSSTAFERTAIRISEAGRATQRLRDEDAFDAIYEEEQAKDDAYDKELAKWVDEIPVNKPITFIRTRRDNDLPNYYTVTKNSTDPANPWRTTYFQTLQRPDWTLEEEIEFEDLFKKTRWHSNSPQHKQWEKRLYELGSRPTTSKDTRIVPSGHEESKNRVEAVQHASSMAGNNDAKLGALFSSPTNAGNNGRPAIQTTDGRTLEAPGQISLFSSPAYHGTPHKVDKFATDKIGSGEGAQAYGWGLYFADSIEVAEGYRQRLSGGQWQGTDGTVYQPLEIREAVDAKAKELGFGIRDRQDAADNWAMHAKGQDMSHLPAFEAIRQVVVEKGIKVQQTGNLYTVTLKVEDEDLLDWDKPLSKQSKKVQAIFDALDSTPPPGFRLPEWLSLTMKGWFEGPGRHNPAVTLYAEITKHFGRQDGQGFKGDSSRLTSKLLAAAGIRGIRYLDGNSRISDAQIELSEKTVAARRAEMEADPSPGREQMLNMAERYLEGLKAKATQGSYNYVIFDDADIEITEENGTPVAPAALFSSPSIGGQGSFDFGTSGSFDTKKQRGFDFSAQAPQPETQRTSGIAEIPAKTAIQWMFALRTGEYESANEWARNVPPGMAREIVDIAAEELKILDSQLEPNTGAKASPRQIDLLNQRRPYQSVITALTYEHGEAIYAERQAESQAATPEAAEQSDIPSFFTQSANNWSLWDMDERVKQAQGVAGLGEDISDTPNARGTTFTPEAAMYQLINHEDFVSSTNGMLMSRNRTNASPNALADVWVSMKRMQNLIAKSRAENPDMWAAYDARQAALQAAKEGDMLRYPHSSSDSPLGGPVKLLKKFKKNWRVLLESGEERLYRPETLRMLEPIRDGTALFSSPASKAQDVRYLDLAQDPEKNAAELRKMVDAQMAAKDYSMDDSYRMMHQAPNASQASDDGSSGVVSLANLKNSELVPADYWTRPEWYLSSATERESHGKIKRAMEGTKIRVYRTIPATAKDEKIRNGDWVTPSRAYAVESGYDENAPVKIISTVATADQLFWDGNSADELGFDDGKSYAYRNTKNNRKRADLVTYEYDEDGNAQIIPLSKRFDYRNSSALFSSPAPVDAATVQEYLESGGAPTSAAKTESERVSQALAQRGSGRLAEDRGAYSQADLFAPGQPAAAPQGEQIADAGARAVARAKARTGRDAVSDDLIAGMSGDWAALAREVNARGRASSILADLINREIPVWNVNGTILDTPEAVHAVMLPLRSPYFESLKVMVLDGNLKTVHSQILTVGSVDSSVAQPAEILGTLARLREIHGKKYTSIIFSHNHPSGDPSPSRADEQVTRRLNAVADMAGWNVLDHIVTNGETYFSFRESGMMGGDSVKETPFTPRKDKGRQAPEITPEDRQAPWEAVKRSALKLLDTPNRIAEVAKHLRNANPDAAHIFYLDTRFKLLAVERVDMVNVLDQKQLTQTLLAARGRDGASNFIIDYPGGSASANHLSRRVSEVADMLQMRFIDAITITSPSGRYESAREAGLVAEESGSLRSSPTQQPGPHQAGFEIQARNIVEGFMSPDFKYRIGESFQPRPGHRLITSDFAQYKEGKYKLGLYRLLLLEGPDGNRYVQAEKGIGNDGNSNGETLTFERMGSDEMERNRALSDRSRKLWEDNPAGGSLLFDAGPNPQQPDLFTAATAPDATQKLGQVKVGTMSALGAYRALTGKRDAGKTLSAKEEEQLLQAETALGQKLAFDMDAVKGSPLEQIAPDLFKKPAKTNTSRSTQQGFSLGDDGPGGQMSLLSSPTPWPESFPNVLQMSTANAVVKHPDHPAAKAGDSDAAARLVMDLAKPDKLRALAARHPQAIVVPVHAEEASGRNKIPSSFADYIGYVTGLQVDESIVQSNEVGRTGKGAWHRLAFRPQFDGQVITGREYIIVDDIVTGGGSLSELRQYIESNGGKVVEMSTLGAAQFSANIRLSEKTLLDLTEKFGKVPLREFLTRENLYAGSAASLTESEARTILRARSLDDAGDRIFAAGQESLSATRAGVFSEARPPSRAQVLEARGITDSPSGESRLASSPTPQAVLTKEERSAKVVVFKELKAKAMVFGKDGNLTALEAERYKRVMNQIDDLIFDLARVPKEEKLASAVERKSTLPFEVVETAWKDAFQDRRIYSPIAQAATGVHFNKDTPIDDIMNGKNKDVSASEFYSAFNRTRTALRETFGESMTLYRATGAQKQKATTNWATTREFAAEFGSLIETRETPVAKILAVNVGPFGTYHEMIVGEPPTSSLAASPTPEASDAIQQALAKMPPVYREVFEAVNAGASEAEVMAKFSITAKAVTNILNSVRSRITAATGAASPAGLKPVMEGDQFKGGRPDLALSTNPEIAAIDQIRNESEVPDVRGWDEVNGKAEAMLAADYQGTYDMLLDKARDLQPMTDTEIAASKMIIAKETLAGKTRTPAERVKIAMMIHGYRDIGTETARSLAIRRDPHKSPAERNAMFVAEALFTPDAATRARLRKAKKGEQEAILAGWMSRVDAIKADLLAQDINLDASLAEFNDAQEARKQAAEESPRAQAAMEEVIRKLSPHEKMVIEAIRSGALLDKIELLTGLDADTILDINARFNAKIRESMVAAAKRFLAGSLGSSPVDMMTQILAELGVWGNDVIDNRKPDFVDRRKEILNPKPRKQKPAAPKKPEAPKIPELTPEEQAAIDAAFERFQNAAPSTWATFWQTEMKTLAPMIGQVAFEEFKGAAVKPWRDLWQTEMDGIATPAARISFEEWIAKPENADRINTAPEMFSEQEASGMTPAQIAELDAAWQRFQGLQPNRQRTFMQTEAAAALWTPEQKAAFEAKMQGEITDWTQMKDLLESRQPVSATTGTFDLNDPIAMMEVMTAFSTARSTTGDAIMEFWKMSILSGPQTHIVNVGSNTLFSAYNLLPRRAVEASANNLLSLVGLGSQESATFGEFSVMARHLKQAAALGARLGLASWKAETRTFEAYANAEPLQLDFTGVGGERFAPALGGKLGKVMRSISFRAMTAADEFGKSFFAQLEAAAQAHRIARVEEKLTGPAYEARLAELLQPGSIAWIRAIDEAKRITFQTDIDGSQPQLIHRIDQLAELAKKGRAMPYLGKPLNFFLPFIDTPTNIAKQAAIMSPLGIFLAVVDGTRALKRKIMRGDLSKAEADAEAALLYNRARLVQDLTNQSIGLMLWFAVESMLEGDDDEDKLPMLTGSMEYRSSKQGERDNAYAVMPPQSLRLGGVTLSYKRFEPFATVLTALADISRESKRAGGMFKPGVGSKWLATFKDQMAEKTFLQGIGNLMDAFENPDRFASKLTGNIVTGFIPNLIRQPIRNIDTTLRESRPRPDQGFFESISRAVGYSIVPQAAPGRIDVWGRPIQRNRGEMIGNRATDAAIRIFDPTNLTVTPDIDPIDRWIYRFNQATADPKDRVGIQPIDSKIQFSVPGEKRRRNLPLSVEEQQQANIRAGQAARAVLADGWDTAELSAENADRIVNTVRQAQSVERARLKMEKIAAGLPPLE